ncbi:MAG TPA: hypothetical protein VET30_10650, partial [Pseudoxanthomonas sp.]|nr:hypothetical protein [Pseudoxanthomonas sp.]
NHEDMLKNAEGEEVGIASLRGTLSFLGDLTKRTYKSIVEPLPYSFLKTVKLLYLRSRDGGDHIFEYLNLPAKEANRPTFEFRLSGHAPRNETKMRAVLDLLAQLEKGISEEKRNQIKGFLLTPFKLLQKPRTLRGFYVFLGRYWTSLD